MRPLWCMHQVTHQGMHQRYTLLVVYNWTQKRSFGQQSFQTIITAYLWSMEMEMGPINSIKALKELIQQQLQLQWCDHNLLGVWLFSVVLNNLRRHERQRAAKALRAWRQHRSTDSIVRQLHDRRHDAVRVRSDKRPDQNVLGLEVTVDDLSTMQVVKCRRHLRTQMKTSWKIGTMFQLWQAKIQYSWSKHSEWHFIVTWRSTLIIIFKNMHSVSCIQQLMMIFTHSRPLTKINN